MSSDETSPPATDIAPLLERAVHIHAPVEAVWHLVSDPRHLTEWSPTVHQVEHHSGEAGAEGSRYANRNRDGELEWTTHSVIVRSQPPRHLSFRIEENWAVWSFDLEVEDDGTRLIQRRRIPDGISPLAMELTEAFMGGQGPFTRSLLRGMDETLARIKAAAEAAAHRPQA